MVAVLAALVLTVSQSPARAAGTLLSQGKPATASSTENATFPASAAFDGNTGTRWSSAFSDPQTAFQIQTSNDGTTWTSIYSTTTGTGGTQTLNAALNQPATASSTENATFPASAAFDGNTGTRWSSAFSDPQRHRLPDPDLQRRHHLDLDLLHHHRHRRHPDPQPSTIPAAQNVVEVKILNRTNGKYPDSQVYWSFNGQTHSIADQPYLDMPANSAGRMYFYLGSPTSLYYDFIEFTVGANVFNGNTTRVDAFGLKLAMRLHAKDGYDVQVGENQQTFAEDRSVTFQRFINAVPAEFKVLAQTQAPYRIIAPGSDPSFQTGGVNAGYFTAYANSVGVNAPTSDIFGCAGVLASNPDECAALNRHVATLPAAQQSDPTQYYLAAPANYYAKFWHDNDINNLAYGFPYDDVAGQSSFISHSDPQWLEVAVGW
ncbi:beta-1,3-glucanase family protein [Streptacidiphilus jeojiense]|uniref:beta-1,3-glucanase family protein n=1 Tax=Streptacidiphilus jeojiense TaxID=436229 RepID=UPI0038CDBDE9